MHPTNPRSRKKDIAESLIRHHKAVEGWFAAKFGEFPAPFYCSVDIRDSGDKIAPVDCNLFPAGFNNICDIDLEHAPPIFRNEILKIAASGKLPPPDKIGIIPENHTENRFYLENLHHLGAVFESAGFEVRFLRLEDREEPLHLSTASEKPLTEYPLRVRDGKARSDDGWTADWLCLNADFPGGYPAQLDQIAQPKLPSPKLGWHTRRKSTHFAFYNRLASELAELMELDPWIFRIESEPVDAVNFSDGAGMDRVIETSRRMLESIGREYGARGIERKPALFIKNDSGTYGIGVMVIHSADELAAMNRRTRNKMSVGKNRAQIDRVILQEGIPTTMTTEGSTSEPVIYMMGESLVGGFIRANRERDDMDNLNSQGMFFRKLCFKDLSDCLENRDFNDFPTLEAAYGLVAKLSALAAAMEIRQALQP